ncbi:S41 family peptidase [Actinoplanes sp. N902-109]|uniref:S41 family peptidase n=1 Tax=Actinoplanes sp. (strain N902-109) TaxID=649831 RepID=UPI0003293EC7|nr:S41 family peptidase [Actinoplanes sp. N902-109]AGL17666.1 hypothetical protein L083_4156 [Actinoplanes sp. N902-109]
MVETLIDAALRLIQEHYIFPAKAGVLAERVRAGDYGGLDEAALCERLTGVFHDVTADKHLRLRVRGPEMHDALTEEQIIAAYRERLKTVAYGIAKVERLEGNVGLLELREIPEAGMGGHAIAAAMAQLAHTAALVIDLRECRGGAPNGVNFLVSYFFPDDGTHLIDIYDGPSGVTRQYWSLAHLPGERYLDRPIVVLTSGTTFSGGEDLAYTVQTHGRATVVGETTRGGAHPTTVFALSPTVEVTVPIARSISPVTGTNWEGTGVVPDVGCPAADALDHALRHLRAGR